MERSVRFKRRPRMFEVHTVREERGEEALGAGEGRVEGKTRRRVEVG